MASRLSTVAVLVRGSEGAPEGRVFSRAAIRAGLVMARYLARIVSGAVASIAFTWAITATRARMAVARSARSTRRDSTAPFRDFGVVAARPASTDSAAW